MHFSKGGGKYHRSLVMLLSLNLYRHEKSDTDGVSNFYGKGKASTACMETLLRLRVYNMPVLTP